MMSAPSREPQRAFVLHRRDFSNTSLLIEVLGERDGRFPALAKGAKQSKIHLMSLLQPFQPLWLRVSGRGEVKTLTAAELSDRIVYLRGHALYCGLYLNELLVRLLGRNDPHEALFSDYFRALTALGGGQNLSGVLRDFEIHLLREIGYAPPLDRDRLTAIPVEAHRRYHYRLEEGPELLSSQMVLDDLPVDEVVTGRTLLALARGESLPDAQASHEARHLMRRLLGLYLGDRPLKSRELFGKIRGAHQITSSW